MKKLVVIGACLFVAVPAFSQSMAEKSGVNSALGISPKTTDFVNEAAMSDIFEIKSSKLAEDKTQGATKDFATKMVADHGKTSDELKSLIEQSSLKVTPPDQLDSSHQKKLDRLKGLDGAEFVKQYDSMQVSAHKSAVSLFKRYAKSGDNPSLKEWATKTEPTLEDHLKMAKNLKKSA